MPGVIGGGRLDRERVERVAQVIRANPNQRVWRYSQLCGIDHRTFQRVLVHCEELGFLLAEDDKGRLMWVGRRRYGGCVVPDGVGNGGVVRVDHRPREVADSQRDANPAVSNAG
jgi:hypothetical protein